MPSEGPSQEWINATAARVVADLQKYARPKNPFTVRDDGVYFDGAIPSSSNKGVEYHVVVTPTSATCTCKGYGYRHTCSHIDAVKETIAQ